ncbi:MAG TPA: virulence protein [Syntrophomonadaceae bacterium]|nr:virulence protein [Syntrophomonadaceae bacterium]
MEIKFDATGARRRELAMTIGEILGITPQYQGVPTFAYVIGKFTVSKDGALCFHEENGGAQIDELLNELDKRGFQLEAPDELVIELPREGFSETAVENLKRLVKSKETLIKKALGADRLPIEQTGDKLRFPWFSGSLTAEEVNAYARFIGALCAMAKNQHRVTATEKAYDNEKYAFRCFLLRLGFIGPEYKEERKVLLSRLTGSAAFKNGMRSPEEGPKHETDPS